MSWKTVTSATPAARAPESAACATGSRTARFTTPVARACFLSGGDRKSLTAGNDFVKNCDLSRFGRIFWTYQSAVNLTDPSRWDHVASAGNVVAHDHIHDAPHAGILFSGNDHHIEYNVIDHVCEWSSDAGAIYGGRDWGYRGNEIRYNFIHDIRSPLGPATHGIYLDDCVSGEHVFGNVLYKASPTSGIMHGGGRDDIIENNIIVKCGQALHTDTRGTSRITHDGSSWDQLHRIEDMSYTQDPWKTAYPALAAIPDDWSDSRRFALARAGGQRLLTQPRVAGWAVDGRGQRSPALVLRGNQGQRGEPGSPVRRRGKPRSGSEAHVAGLLHPGLPADPVQRDRHPEVALGPSGFPTAVDFTSPPRAAGLWRTLPRTLPRGHRP